MVVIEKKDGSKTSKSTIPTHSSFKDSEKIYVTEGGIITSAKLDPATMYVSSGGVANQTDIRIGASLYVSNGGVVNETEVRSGGSLVLLSGGESNDALVCSAGGRMVVSAFGTANRTTVEALTQMTVSANGFANSTTVTTLATLNVVANGFASATTACNYGIASVEAGGLLSGSLVRDYGSLQVLAGGRAFGNEVNANGLMHVSSGGFASWTVLSGTAMMKVSSGGSAVDIDTRDGGRVEVYDGAEVGSTWVNAGGSFCLYNGGVARDTSIYAGGAMTISSGAVHVGSMTIEQGGSVSVKNGGVIDFNVAECRVDNDVLINDISLITCADEGSTFAVTVPWMTTGTYYLAGGELSGGLTLGVKTPDGLEHNKLKVGGLLYIDQIAYTLDYNGEEFSLTITPDNGFGNAYGVSVFEGAGIVAYGKNGGYLIVDLNESQSMVNTYGLSGTYHWEWYGERGTLSGDVTGQAVISPQYYRAYENNSPDLFFANAKGVWEGGYAAKHVGFPGREGTGASVNLAGKNKIVDVFVGAYSYGQVFGEASILALTDDANGDALFLDDIYSAIPTATQQARLDNIMEIRAGAGDDVVDLTSQRFDFDSQLNGVRIYGGDGNDTIWASYGSNELYGDAGNDHIVGGNGDDWIIGGAGNDTMHGFGGSDTFFFGSNWGNDVVEQFSDGEVTLWFKTGSSNNWDVAALKYSDGLGNSVQVKGVIADNVTLKFGDAQSSAPAYAFDDSATKKVYETSFFA